MNFHLACLDYHDWFCLWQVVECLGVQERHQLKKKIQDSCMQNQPEVNFLRLSYQCSSIYLHCLFCLHKLSYVAVLFLAHHVQHTDEECTR